MPTSHRSVGLTVAIGMWNLAWEAGQFRRRFFDPDELPDPLAKLAELGDRNIQFVSKIRSKYFEHATLLHLLPTSTLERYGLPLFRAGKWPFAGRAVNPCEGSGMADDDAGKSTAERAAWFVAGFGVGSLGMLLLAKDFTADW